MMEFIVKKGDITKEEVNAIVNPANSFGLMGGGVAYAIKKIGGKEIENEAISKAPILIGKAIITTSGKLPSKFVIHAPTMKYPAEKISVENVKKATYAALECASKHKLISIAFPGMGTGVGGVKKEDAARVMVKTIKEFFRKNKNSSINKVVLIGYDYELYMEFKKALG